MNNTHIEQVLLWYLRCEFDGQNHKADDDLAALLWQQSGNEYTNRNDLIDALSRKHKLGMYYE